MSKDPSAYIVRIHQIVFGLGLLLVGLSTVQGLMYGSRSNIMLLASVIIGTTVVLALGKRYWILFPLLTASGFKVPGLPFDAAELGCIAVIGAYFVRTSVRRDETIRHPSIALVALPFIVWVLIVWMQKPTGMNIFGSETIGGRRYFQIILAFLVLNVLSRIRFTEKDCKIVFWGIFLFATMNILVGRLTSHSFLTGGSEGESLTAYVLDSAVTPCLLLLCLYPLRQFLSVSWKSVIVMVFALGVIASGRRTNFGKMLIMPFILVMLRRRETMLTAACAIAGTAVLALVVQGQGRLYELPVPAQRALSTLLPGKWDRRLAGYGKKDPFRAEMIAAAKRQIRSSPWFGTGGYAIDRRELIWAAQASKEIHAGHIVGRNWHNKWYGMAADFGIPLSLAWGLFAVTAALYTLRHTRQTWRGGYVNALLLYYASFMFNDLIFAFGDAANSPFYQWPCFAMVIGLARVSEQEAYQDDIQGTGQSI